MSEKLVRPLSLQEADAELWKARPTTALWDIPQWGIVLLSITATTGFNAYALSRIGNAAFWFVFVLSIPFVLAPFALALGSFFQMFRDLWHARKDFFERIEQAQGKQARIIEGLAMNGTSWIKERRFRLLHDTEKQTQRSALLLGRATNLGIVYIFGAVYLAYINKQLPQDLWTQTFSLCVAALAMGMFLGFVRNFFHQERIRALLLALDLAEQQLEDPSAEKPAEKIGD